MSEASKALTMSAAAQAVQETPCQPRAQQGFVESEETIALKLVRTTIVK